MIVRRHMVLMAAQTISQRVIADIHQQIEIEAPDGFLDGSLCLPGSKTGDFRVQQVGVFLITGESQRVLVLAFPFRPPFHQIFVDSFGERLAALQRDNSQRAYGNGFQVSFFFAVAHDVSLSILLRAYWFLCCLNPEEDLAGTMYVMWLRHWTGAFSGCGCPAR